MEERKNRREAILTVTIFAFVSAFILHELYKWTGGNRVVGLFVPVNESVWEHLKLAFYPVVVLMVYPLTKYQQQYPMTARIQSAAMASFLALCVVLFGYYGIHTGLGINGPKIDLMIDIGLLLVGDFLGIYHGFAVADKNRGKIYTAVSLLWIFGMTLLFWWFTTHPGSAEVFRIP